uniref:Uncharacterized protein n=1 Tax=Pundamilia nyererei TaxID=303518 RepID=A0A3B4F9U7_9CICH
NAAAKDAAVAALTAQGCTVEVSDLYAMKFKAAATTEDITGIQIFFKERLRKGEMCMVLVKKRKKGKALWVVAMIFSIILLFNSFPFLTKRVQLGPIPNGILNYCGFQVFAPQIFWDPATGSPESRSSMLEGWRTRLQNLCGEATVYFAPLDYFDKEKGFLLKPEVKEKYASKESGLTVGIHMGKPLPANSQTKAAV